MILTGFGALDQDGAISPSCLAELLKHTEDSDIFAPKYNLFNTKSLIASPRSARFYAPLVILLTSTVHSHRIDGLPNH
jgi:hypothetical protein